MQGPWLLMATSRFSASESSEKLWTLRFHAPQAMQTSFASPYGPGKRRPSLKGPLDIPRPRTSSTMGITSVSLWTGAPSCFFTTATQRISQRSQRSFFHRSDVCRAGRCAHISKLRSSSKSSRVRARALYASSGAVGLIFARALIGLEFCPETWGIERASIQQHTVIPDARSAIRDPGASGSAFAPRSRLYGASRLRPG